MPKPASPGSGRSTPFRQYVRPRYVLPAATLILLIALVGWWQIDRATADCAGRVTTHQESGNQVQLAYEGSGFSSSISSTSEVPWRVEGRSATGETCTLVTYPHHWLSGLQPYVLGSVYLRLLTLFPPPDIDPWATLTLRTSAAEEATLDEWQQRAGATWAPQTHRQQPTAAIYGAPTFTRLSIGGQPAVKMTGTIDNPGQPVYVATTVFVALEGAREHTVTWSVYSKSAQARDAYVQRHQDEIAAIVSSIRLK